MNEVVTSPQNQFVKLALSLGQKKYRDETGLFVIEGVKLVEEALNSGWVIDYCLVTGQAAAKERVQNILEKLITQKTRVIQVTDEIFHRLAQTEQPQGILAVAQKRELALEQVLDRNQIPLLVILESVQDPGNVGTLIRTADAAGSSGVILTKGCADIFSGKTVRASMGSIFHLPIATSLESEEILAALKKRNVRLFATSLATRNLYHDVDMNGPVAIVFGNEGSGVREDILQAADELIYIPIYGRAESLNVAASAAVILFEAMRQRRVVL